MKAIVCGGRDFSDFEFVVRVLDNCGVTELIHGGAKGADSLADKWAEMRGVTRYVFPADWKTHGRKAGPLRNQQMLDEGLPDAVIAFPGGRGTDDMIRRARKDGIPLIDTQDDWIMEKKLAAAATFMQAMGSND